MQKQFMKNDGGTLHLNKIQEKISELENNYPISIRERIYIHLDSLLSECVWYLENCDTPIEFILANEISQKLNVFNEGSKYRYYLHTQVQILVKDKKYRVDLLLAPVQHEFCTEYPNLIIECDGHNFHEKTKEQAQKDKQRNRDLQSAGYKVIRFTGSEIFKNPYKCASEVLHFLKQIE
jgi:very-short-patch-repair endonuclease